MDDIPINPQRYVKQDTPVGRSKATLDSQTYSRADQFQRQCLTEVSDFVISAVSEGIQEQISKIEGAKDENEGYLRSVELLKQHIPEAYGADNIITFIVKKDDHPRHHPCGYNVHPDILALPQRIQKQLEGASSWHHLVSVGEWQPGSVISDAKSGQEREYVACASQARPDNPSILGIIMCRGGYILGWGSPCGYVVTKQLEFKNIAPLICYVHSLHVPPHSINFAGPARTIVLDDMVGVQDEPHWRITSPTYNIYNRLFSVIFVGAPFSRMTTVFVNKDEGVLTIIKIIYMPLLEHQREKDLFDALGEDPPGWVAWQKPSGDDSASFQSLSLSELDGTSFIPRRSVWLVFRTTGDPFEKCSSLSEVVGATYDILEASRWAIVKRRVLHRDISPRNILIRPKPPSLPKEGACFIKGVYEETKNSPSLAVLYDLDNGVKLPEKDLSLKEFHEWKSSDSRELKALSGTPMYIARGLSLGTYMLSPWPTFCDLPEIQSPEASELYARAYPKDPLRTMRGTLGIYNEALRNECEQDLPHTLNLIQRPWHDAESTIFVFLIFLLRSKPEKSSLETYDELYPMQDLYSRLRDTPIGTLVDYRDNLLRMTTKLWSRTLHADLKDVVPSIVYMCQALLMDYEFLIPAEGVNREVVLHELLQRQLFELYYRLRKGLLRDVELGRYSPSMIPAGVDTVYVYQSLVDGTAEPHSTSESQKRVRLDCLSQSQSRKRSLERAAEGMTVEAEKTRIIDQMKPKPTPRSDSTSAGRAVCAVLEDEDED